ncbi:MAG: N-acetyltransferase [Leptolyngbyaceae cyanobacterium SU_3_3]|nr:N-acetyltransferase [Leptolyngbyaceae cyanobacterium SU_3_3]NJR50184.1 N-acetyltransferase [Leptolyngbyaceae cyanobacterium CSU_1_3]
MVIRDAVEADLSAIVALYNSTIPTRIVTADIEPVSVESRLVWFHAHTATERPLWVMEIDGTIAGWLGFQSFYGRPAYRETVELSLYVASEFRRRGVGRRLLARAIAFSPSLQITTLLGFIFADNRPSIQLFQQYGFEPWGLLPGVAKFKETGEQDLVIVGRKVALE